MRFTIRALLALHVLAALGLIVLIFGSRSPDQIEWEAFDVVEFDRCLAARKTIVVLFDTDMNWAHVRHRRRAIGTARIRALIAEGQMRTVRVVNWEPRSWTEGDWAAGKTLYAQLVSDEDARLPKVAVIPGDIRRAVVVSDLDSDADLYQAIVDALHQH